MIQVIELINKDIKTVNTTVFCMFKKLEGKAYMLIIYMKKIKRGYKPNFQREKL